MKSRTENAFEKYMRNACADFNGVSHIVAKHRELCPCGSVSAETPRSRTSCSACAKLEAELNRASVEVVKAEKRGYENGLKENEQLKKQNAELRRKVRKC